MLIFTIWYQRAGNMAADMMDVFIQQTFAAAPSNISSLCLESVARLISVQAQNLMKCIKGVKKS